MSRWDALKNPAPSQERKQRPTRDGRERCSVCSSSRPTTTPSEVLHRYRRLIRCCHHDDHPDEHHLATLIQLLEEHADIVPPEENAKQVVAAVFLHRLETMLLSSTTTTTAIDTSNASICTAIFACIESLLQHTKHRSALLAPLTVLETTEVVYIPNPIRTRLFDTLQRCLLTTTTTTTTTTTKALSSAKCLAVVLQAAKKVDRGSSNNNNGATQEIKIWYIQEYFRMWQSQDDNDNDNDRDDNHAFALLQAVLDFRPNVSVALFRILLLRHHRSDSTTSTIPQFMCADCGLARSGLPKLLSTLHNNNTSTSSKQSAAMNCIATMLRQLPLDEWIGALHTTHRSSSRRNTVAGHSWGFRDKVICMIEDVLQIIHCIIQKGNHHHLDGGSFEEFVAVVLNQVPFHEEEQLCRTGETLVDALSGIQSFRMILAKCFGGLVKPNGQLTKTPSPIRNWLVANKEFTLAVFEYISKSATFACGLVRSEPLLVLCDSTVWTKFKQGVFIYMDIDAGAAAQVMASLVGGREAICAEDFSNAVLTATDLLGFVFQCLESFPSGSSRFQLAACSILGCLQEADWEEIPMTGIRYIEQTSELCLEERTSQKVKVEAYRALGKMCLRLLRCKWLRYDERDDSSSCGITLIHTVIFAILQSDTKIQVRAMALFTAGNLLQSMHYRSVSLQLIDPSAFFAMAALLSDCVYHDEEKIGVNALRSAGILCRLLLDKSCTFSSTDDNFTEKYVFTVFEACCANLNAAIATSVEGLTWKQRSSVKKRARASCRCLEIVFEAVPKDNNDCMGLCIKPLTTLLGSMREITIIDERLAISILTTLRSMSRCKLSLLMPCFREDDSIIVCCFEAGTTILFAGSFPERSAVRMDLELTMMHLLGALTKTSASKVLQQLGREESEKMLTRLAEIEEDNSVLALFANLCSAFSLDVNIQLMIQNKIGAKLDNLDEL